MSMPIDFVPPFQKDLPALALAPLYEASKPAIRHAAQVLALGVNPVNVFGPIPAEQQVEASALSMALALGNLLSSGYSTARETYGRERAHDWLLTTLEWFAKIQRANEVNLNVRITERE